MIPIWSYFTQVVQDFPYKFTDVQLVKTFAVFKEPTGAGLCSSGMLCAGVESL